jgi:aspartate/tyrosine/aromatic aminotransferase
MKKNSLIPFFDIAYQGFASGDLDNDAWAVRHFLSEGFQMIITQSFAKNLGLYGERIGAVHIVTASPSDTLYRELSALVGNTFEAPPLHGSLLVDTILSDSALFNQWKTELREVVAKRIISMRIALRQHL